MRLQRAGVAVVNGASVTFDGQVTADNFRLTAVVCAAPARSSAPQCETRDALSGGTQGGILSTGAVTLKTGTNFQVALNGAAAGTGYSQLNVNGAVNLLNSVLTATLNFTPALGDPS